MKNTIADNLKKVREEIGRACEKAGRNPEEVILCAVSKTKPAEAVAEAMEAGQIIFGENYVQEITEKYEILGSAPRWHMIGHLQTNKVKYIVDKVELIHSVDSLHLAQRIEKEAAKKNLAVNILLEVNAAAEETKFGFTPEQAVEAARAIADMPHIKIKGLMTSAPITEDAESNRPYFALMKKTFEEIKAMYPDKTDMTILSMGMSGDYQVAIEEGSTMVRVGTAIFGARNYSV